MELVEADGCSNNGCSANEDDRERGIMEAIQTKMMVILVMMANANNSEYGNSLLLI